MCCYTEVEETSNVLPHLLMVFIDLRPAGAVFFFLFVCLLLLLLLFFSDLSYLILWLTVGAPL